MREHVECDEGYTIVINTTIEELDFEEIARKLRELKRIVDRLWTRFQFSQ